MALGDYCPYVQEFSWKASDGTTRGTLCTNKNDQPKNTGENLNYGLETYAESSRCIEQGKVWDQESCSIIKQWHRYGAGCYGKRNVRVEVVLKRSTIFVSITSYCTI